MIEQPAVIIAAQATVLDDSVSKVGASMTALAVDQAQFAAAVAKQDRQLFLVLELFGSPADEIQPQREHGSNHHCGHAFGKSFVPAIRSRDF